MKEKVKFRVKDTFVSHWRINCTFSVENDIFQVTTLTTSAFSDLTWHIGHHMLQHIVHGGFSILQNLLLKSGILAVWVHKYCPSGSPTGKSANESFGEQGDQLINVSLARHESLWEHNCVTEHCQCSCEVLTALRFTWTVGLLKCELWVLLLFIKTVSVTASSIISKNWPHCLPDFLAVNFLLVGYLNAKVHEIPPTRIPDLQPWIQQCLEGTLHDLLKHVMTYVIGQSFINIYPSIYLCVYYILQNK